MHAVPVWSLSFHCKELKMLITKIKWKRKLTKN